MGDLGLCRYCPWLRDWTISAEPDLGLWGLLVLLVDVVNVVEDSC